MSKYTVTELWSRFFGTKQEVYDYAGRRIKRSACGNPSDPCHPTLDHIRPLSRSGCDAPGNLIICHRDTNAEKADHFPHWKANGAAFHACRIRGSRTSYRIVRDQAPHAHT